MMKIFFLFIFLSSVCFIHAQRYDLVVTTRNDSIACLIDSLTDSRLYFKIKNEGTWIPTYLDKDKIMNYQTQVLDKKSIRFKPHSSNTAPHEPSTSDTLVNNTIRKNSVYYEFLGNGFFFGSVNYDRLFPVNAKISIVLRGGLAYAELPFFLAEVSGLFGANEHFFDTGLGSSTFFIITEENPELFLHAGYRFQGKKGLLIRVTPLYCITHNFFWFGISAGYSF